MSVRLALLGLLREAPRHGYDLKREFETRTGGVWPLNVGQVYTTLERLERDGLVAPVGGVNGSRNQRAYTITAAGGDALEAWLSTTQPGEVPRDDLLVKLLVVVGADPRAALAVIDAQRAALLARLQAARPDGPPADLATELVNDAIAVRAEADLRWLDRCEARLLQLSQSTRSTPRRIR